MIHCGPCVGTEYRLGRSTIVIDGGLIIGMSSNVGTPSTPLELVLGRSLPYREAHMHQLSGRVCFAERAGLCPTGARGAWDVDYPIVGVSIPRPLAIVNE